MRLARYRSKERGLRCNKKRILPANRYVLPKERLKAPVQFDVTRGSGKEVAKFLRAIARAVLELKMSVKLDFRLTETFYPAGTILLFAEIDRIASISELSKPLTIINPTNRRAREVLKQIGLHDITQDQCNVVPERDDVVYWRATKGKDQSGSKLAILEVVAEKANKDHANQLELSGVWRGVSEAVANSVEHAYKVARRDGFTGLPDTRWWMFTQLREGTFTVAVCDLGCGYRATIGHTIPENFLSTIGATLKVLNRDAYAIETAMTYGRSGTKDSERGKGSRDAISVVVKHGDGMLMILSNTGWIRYIYKDGKQISTEEGDLGIDIKGTIVWWRLPLKG